MSSGSAWRSEVVIAGDQDLLVLDPFQQIRILTPSAFWRWEGEQQR
jgi:predicted nucleic acid-binding protein